ncbi:hypothetical protein [Actinomadura rugatobispora]|uniref:Uncharacterized protein n=1 Tax=Actinomadura rugatobispora TaxID=1994 RepID=A0ABW0ZUQ1_9ACTN|nr:hypothetical protein GCM10010200_009160 [Actinomadura rugatobispora]
MRKPKTDVAAQLKAVQVLAELLAQDLPPTAWSVYARSPACLHGNVEHSGSDTPDGIGAAHDEIEQWARFLKVDVVTRQNARRETLHLLAEGVHKGVEIEVVAIVPDDGGAWRERLGS